MKTDKIMNKVNGNGKKNFGSYFSILGEFVKNVQQTGAIAPDSSAIVKAFCQSIPQHPSTVIVEYGPGTGTVSRGIINQKHSDSRLICFEKNPRLFRILENNMARENVFVVNDDAFNSPIILAEKFNLRLNSVDCFISTLPITFLNYDHLIRDKICPLLKEDGLFITYQYLTAKVKVPNFASKLEDYFEEVSTEMVLWNLPPATVYTSRMKKLRLAEV